MRKTLICEGGKEEIGREEEIAEEEEEKSIGGGRGKHKKVIKGMDVNERGSDEDEEKKI